LAVNLFTWAPNSSFSLTDLFLDLDSIFTAASAWEFWTIILNTENTHHMMWTLDKIWNQVTFSLAWYSLSAAKAAFISHSSVGNLYTVPYIINYLDTKNKMITFGSLPPFARFPPHYLRQHRSLAKQILVWNCK
jgi:hypothetical protein